MNRPEVLALFAAQHWVASSAQLAALGVGRSTLSRARQLGVVATPVRGVVAVAGVELSLEGRALAAQLAAGREAFVSGPTAGALRGLRDMPRHRVELTIREHRRVLLPDGHRLVRTSWLEETRDVERRTDGIRIASPLRMLFGLAEQFNQHRFERAAEDVWHKGLVTPDEAGEYLAAIRRSGRTGVIRMETWLERTACRPPRDDRPERPRAGVRRDDRTGRPPDARAPAPPRPGHGRADPPRPGMGRRPARRRARPLVVARRRPPPAPGPGSRPRLRRGRLARGPLRRDGGAGSCHDRPRAARPVPPSPVRSPRFSGDFVPLSGSEQRQKRERGQTRAAVISWAK